MSTGSLPERNDAASTPQSSTIIAVGAALRGRLSSASHVADAGGDASPGLWHETGRRAALRVECGSVADVRTAVRVAAEHTLPMTVWGGRRDVVARNTGTGELVIDLRRLRDARYDPRNASVTVGGGATVRDVLRTLPADRVTATTSNPDVGMVAGGTGGGYGPLIARFGLVCDQVLRARVVLADGTEADAGPDADHELWWGMRGGGPGFGVVTEMTFAVHHLDHVLNTVVVVPLETAAEALRVAQDLIDAEPDDLAVLPLFSAGPDGAPVLALVTHWTGTDARGEHLLAALVGIRGAQVAVRQRVPFAATFSPAEDPLWPLGRRWATVTSTISRLDGDTADALVAGARAMPGPRSVLFLHDFHGAAARVSPQETAFPLRREHFVAMAAGPSAPDDVPTWDRERAWAEETMRALAPGALPGGYVNFLPASGADRVAAFYGDALPRLHDLKNRTDPRHLFGSVPGVGGLAARDGARGSSDRSPGRP